MLSNLAVESTHTPPYDPGRARAIGPRPGWVNGRWRPGQRATTPALRAPEAPASFCPFEALPSLRHHLPHCDPNFFETVF